MVFSRILRNLIRDKELGKHIVPIIPDEARTFGMDPLFKEVGIYSALGQRYEPVDSDLVLSYREATDGQVLEEGITEAGSMASFQAAGTSYSVLGQPMIPFYIFYSMFGFQRTGDQMWAFGDARGRGFLMGATAGRTTLTGEGLQHDDGHTHIHASTIPNIRAYDPAFAYELAAIVRDGVERMYVNGEDVFYYVTIHNENYVQPPLPDGDGVRDGILRGLYRYAAAPELEKDAQVARLVGSGSILQQVIAARDLLAEKFGVAAEVYSAPSFQLLRKDALEAERWNRLHPDAEARVPYVSQVLPHEGGPIVAATDWLKTLPDMVSRWLPPYYVSLGTDGFGRSDTRENLRALFEIDPPHIAAATMVGLVRCGALEPKVAAKAIRELGLDPEKLDPVAL
jgi:pyruvate dehydrogenase E1 component